MSDAITSFTGEYACLSNFSVCPVPLQVPIFGGRAILVPTNEHYFNAFKTLDANERIAICEAKTAREAKALGRKCTLRADWEVIKLAIMHRGLHEKFFSNYDAAVILRGTEDRILMEGNTWKDFYWGVDAQTLAGYNWLGRLLMLARAELALG